MSLNPHLGHLYHDGQISSIYTTLDVQETLKTREINARETKYLNKYSQVLDRAKSVCRRRNEWEQSCLRKQLKNIESKTPSLTTSLRLESERVKNSRNRRHSQSSRPHFPDIHNNQNPYTDYHVKESTEEQHPLFVSSWSVYSNRMTRNKSAPVSTGSYGDAKHRHDRNEMHDTSKRLKNSNCIKKAERITKTLHKLYTQTTERKLKENHMTVLDVLGKESKEELEKALFVLRGTPAGDIIENILKERKFVSRKRFQTRLISSDKSDSSENVSDVFVTRTFVDYAKSDSFDEMENDKYREIIKSTHSTDDNAPNCERHDSRDHLWTQDVFTAHAPTDRSDTSHWRTMREPVNSISDGSNYSKSANSSETSALHKRWTRETEATNINEVFKRDDTWMMSSTLANASDIETPPVTLRWTELFKTPELWKQRKIPNKSVNTAKKMSLVTLTGKRRQTMLKK